MDHKTFMMLAVLIIPIATLGDVAYADDTNNHSNVTTPANVTTIPTNVIPPANVTTTLPTNVTTPANVTTTIPINVTTHANVTTTIPTNVTIHANVTTTIPTNVTIHANVTTTIPTNVTTPANQILPNMTTSLNSRQQLNSNQEILDELLSWNLYNFYPDQININATTRILGSGPSGHSLSFNGNSSMVEYDSSLVNTTNIITSAWVKPTYDGSDNYVVLNDPAGFTLELKNSTQGYHAELSIYDGNMWHIFQSPAPVKEKWTYLFAMFDGKSVIIGVDGEFKEAKINTNEDFLLDDIAYAKYENIPSNVVNYTGEKDSHIHIGTMSFHAGHYNYFSGQIDNVIIYPNHVEQLNGIISILPNFINFSNITSSMLGNVTIPIPTNITTSANVPTAIPTNVTTSANVTAAIPTNVTASASQILSNATLNLNFSENSIKGLKSAGKVKTTEGLNGTALKLGGSGLIITTTNQTNSLTGLTISTWVKPNYEQGSSVFTILSKENSFLLQVNNNMPPQRTATFSIFDGIQWHTVQSNSTIPEEWTHIAATFDGKEISIYINGNKEASLPVSTIGISITGKLETKNVENLQSGADVLIGGMENIKDNNISVANFFSGTIDDVSIFKYQLKDPEIYQLYQQGATLKDQLAISTLPVVPSITNLKNNYLITDSPSFEFQYYTESDLMTAVKKITPSLEPVQHDAWQKKNEIVNVDVTDPHGTKIATKSMFTELRKGKFSIKLASMRDIAPGIYKMKVTLVKDGKTYSSEDQFAWGLVSLNTEKSIYKPGETANFEIVVLDNAGHSVCDSNISMNIKDPNSNITTLSSNNGITKGSECGLYDAQYVTSTEGNYTIDINAQNPSGMATFSTSFLVQSNYSFDIIRTAQSKIDPINNPNSFNVKIDVTSFAGKGPVTILEYVPSSFNLTTDGLVQTNGDTTTISWIRNFDGNNKTSVSYNYSVPLVFPKLYALGSVQIDYGNQVFTEARQWFVANDPQSAGVNTGTTAHTATATPITAFTLTPTAGRSDMLLVVGVSSKYTSTPAATFTVLWGGSGGTCTGGTALTRLATVTGTNAATPTYWVQTDLWYLPIGTGSGTATNICVSWSGTVIRAAAGAALYSNVDQTTPFTTAVNTGSSTTATATSGTASVTATQTGSRAVGVISEGRPSTTLTGYTISSFTSGTQEWNSNGATTAASSLEGGGATSTATTKGSASTIAATFSGSSVWSEVVGELKIKLISLTDSLQLTDSVSRTAKLSRSLSDSLPLSDSVSATRLPKSVSTSLSDTLSMTDSVSATRLPKSVSTILSDSLPLSDSVSRTAKLSSSLSDTLPLSDSVSRTAKLSSSLSDTLSMTDSVSATRLPKSVSTILS
ncbi:MAG: hypothetical protein KGI28_08455, partial [Thaumarchaeota archaeon]|nr:hypothetical protein [Nitrososphaerota archaeon]